ncbi:MULTISPECIES: hypothetical protein [unclassified Streptomyces]|uniref:hypothetical protein n=1 Tax=unclassified Streptomyces TaxID=2593676 RepID=UPI001E2F818D|nr:hypothetical protein [Streptomyces sp. MBT42]MCD2469470.1 hypothetical protein [Streptomyces sp. MBT42]
MDWGNLFNKGVQFVQHATYAALVESWLRADDETAHAMVARYAEASPADERARLEEALITHGTTHFDLQARARMMRFYGTFKVVEMLCHGGLR